MKIINIDKNLMHIKVQHIVVTICKVAMHKWVEHSLWHLNDLLWWGPGLKSFFARECFGFSEEN